MSALKPKRLVTGARLLGKAADVAKAAMFRVMRGRSIGRRTVEKAIRLAWFASGVVGKGAVKTAKGLRDALGRALPVDAFDRVKVLQFLVAVSEKDLAEIALAAGIRSVRAELGDVFRIKGLFLELGFRKQLESLEPRFLTKLVNANKSGKMGVKWVEKVFILRNAVTDTEKGVGQLVVAVDDTDKPTRLWIMAIVESKAEWGGLDIVTGKGGIGQAEKSLKRVDLFGVDFGKRPNIDRFLSKNSSSGVDLASSGEEGLEKLGRMERSQIVLSNRRVANGKALPPEEQITELLGVLPPDANPTIRALAEALAKEKGIQLFTNDGMTSRNAEHLARRTMVEVPPAGKL